MESMLNLPIQSRSVRAFFVAMMLLTVATPSRAQLEDCVSHLPKNLRRLATSKLYDALVREISGGRSADLPNRICALDQISPSPDTRLIGLLKASAKNVAENCKKDDGKAQTQEKIRSIQTALGSIARQGQDSELLYLRNWVTLERRWMRVGCELDGSSAVAQHRIQENAIFSISIVKSEESERVLESLKAVPAIFQSLGPSLNFALKEIRSKR